MAFTSVGAETSASKTGLIIDGQEFAANADEIGETVPDGVALN